MTDYADIVRDYIIGADPLANDLTILEEKAIAALDALVAERDAWKVEAVHHSGEAIRLREALEKIIEGDAAHQSYAMLMQIARTALAPKEES